MQIESGKIYRHFKGDYYVVVGIAQHTGSDVELVIYHPLCEPDELFARPLHTFFEEVKPHGYGKQSIRFVPVEREEI